MVPVKVVGGIVMVIVVTVAVYWLIYPSASDNNSRVVCFSRIIIPNRNSVFYGTFAILCLVGSNRKP